MPIKITFYPCVYKSGEEKYREEVFPYEGLGVYSGDEKFLAVGHPIYEADGSSHCIEHKIIFPSSEVYRIEFLENNHE